MEDGIEGDPSIMEGGNVKETQNGIRPTWGVGTSVIVSEEIYLR